MKTLLANICWLTTTPSVQFPRQCRSRLEHIWPTWWRKIWNSDVALTSICSSSLSWSRVQCQSKREANSRSVSARLRSTKHSLRNSSLSSTRAMIWTFSSIGRCRWSSSLRLGETSSSEVTIWDKPGWLRSNRVSTLPWTIWPSLTWNRCARLWTSSARYHGPSTVKSLTPWSTYGPLAVV